MPRSRTRSGAPIGPTTQGPDEVSRHGRHGWGDSIARRLPRGRRHATPTLVARAQTTTRAAAAAVRAGRELRPTIASRSSRSPRGAQPQTPGRAGRSGGHSEACRELDASVRRVLRKGSAIRGDVVDESLIRILGALAKGLDIEICNQHALRIKAYSNLKLRNQAPACCRSAFPQQNTSPCPNPGECRT